MAFLGSVQESQVAHKGGARLKAGGDFSKNGKDCPITAARLPILGFLGRVAKSAPFSPLLAASRRRPSNPSSSRERPALDDRVRYPGLLAAYLPCGRVSQVAAKEARPPTRASLLAPTCRIDGWMLHRTRSDNGQLGPIYALTCEARVAESMRESWGLLDYSRETARGPKKDQQTTSAAQARKPCVVDAVS